MINCIDRLLSINNPCTQVECAGIYDITDVMGFTWNKAAGIAEGNFKEYTGYQIASKVRRISAKTVMADLMAELYTRGWATNLTNGSYTTGEFKTKAIGASTAKRGVQITSHGNCVYAGMKLVNISIKGSTDITTNLHILADGIETILPITLQANVQKTITNICGSNGQQIFTGDNSMITIWIEDVLFRPIEVKPNCPTCSGGVHNSCGVAKGWSMAGTTVTENKTLAYGILAVVNCECNYDSILCSFPNDEMKAQIMKYQASIQFARLGLETERFNYFTIYGREELLEYIAIAQNGYAKRIKQYADSLRGYLMTNKFCGCIQCNGSELKSLV